MAALWDKHRARITPRFCLPGDFQSTQGVFPAAEAGLEGAAQMGFAGEHQELQHISNVAGSCSFVTKDSLHNSSLIIGNLFPPLFGCLTHTLQILSLPELECREKSKDSLVPMDGSSMEQPDPKTSG